MIEFLKRLAKGEVLSEAETYQIFSSFMGQEQDAPTDAQIAAYLYATSVRRPSSDELAGGVRALRDHMTEVSVPSAGALLDTCGTGGSGYDTFNTSTLSAFVVAAAGQPVAKHGNRGATSRCGSADLLEALGLRMDLSPEALSTCLEQTNFCFMFAPAHHAATARVAKLRKQLGFRTMFNFLGPLCNPAGAALQLLGVSNGEMLEVMAETLAKTGTQRALVVRGEDGIDEISVCEKTKVLELVDGGIKEYEITPEQFGISRAKIEDVLGAPPAEAATRAKELLLGQSSPYRDIVAINAGAALYVAQKAATIEEGYQQAGEILSSGEAYKVLEAVVEFCNQQ